MSSQFTQCRNDDDDDSSNEQENGHKKNVKILKNQPRITNFVENLVYSSGLNFEALCITFTCELYIFLTSTVTVQ